MVKYSVCVAKIQYFLKCALFPLAGISSLVLMASAAPLAGSYHGVVVNFKTNEIHVQPSSSVRSRTPDNHSRIWDIFVHDRKVDQVMSLNDKFMEWHSYKLLDRTTFGDLVAHQQYSVKFPTRYPWIDFNCIQLQADGEKPALVARTSLANHKLEAIYVIYVFRSGDLVQVAYDPKGSLGRCGLMQQDGINTIFFGLQEVKANFSKYAIPETVSPAATSVVVNSFMQAGLDKVDFLPLPVKAQLDHVFLIKQYDSARLFDVSNFDLHGKQISNQICQFASRPVDALTAKLFKTGR